MLGMLPSLPWILAAAGASIPTISPTWEKHLPFSTQSPPPTKTEAVSWLYSLAIAKLLVL